MAELAVAARPVLLDFRRIPVATIGCAEIQVHQFGAIELLIFAPEDAAQHTSKPRNNFHAIVLSTEVCENSSRIFQLIAPATSDYPKSETQRDGQNGSSKGHLRSSSQHFASPSKKATCKNSGQLKSRFPGEGGASPNPDYWGRATGSEARQRKPVWERPVSGEDFMRALGR